MDSRRTVRLVWIVCGLLIGLNTVSYGIELLNQDGSKSGLNMAGLAVWSIVLPVSFAIVGALIVSRQPRNTIGWLLLLQGGVGAVISPIEVYLKGLGPSAAEPSVALLLMVWFRNWNWLLFIIPLLHIPLLYPNGRPLSARWRWVSTATIAWSVLFVLIVTLASGLAAEDLGGLTLDNPIGVLDAELVEPLVIVWQAGLLVLAVLCVSALFVRYRRAMTGERQQIKWLWYVCAIFLVVYGTALMTRIGDTTGLTSDLFRLAFGLIVTAFPAAIGIAILRYQLFDIDIIINRTLVYTLLTLTLGLVYVGGILLGSILIAPLAGRSELTIVASTLAIVALFRPLQRRIQNLIDRLFYRQKYDAARVLAMYGQAIHNEVDIEQLTAAFVRVTNETLQPAHISVWLATKEER